MELVRILIGFTFMLLFEKHCINLQKQTFNSLLRFLSITFDILSSVITINANSLLLKIKNKSRTNISNKISTKIKPSGTPYDFSQELYDVLILIRCFYSINSLDESKLKPLHLVLL